MRGYAPALFEHASSEYSSSTGVVLVATTRVHHEAVRHPPDIATRRKLPLAKVLTTWNELVVPHVRFVHMGSVAVHDPRVGAISELYVEDAPTAAPADPNAPAT